MNKFKQWIRNPQVWGFGLSIIILAVISLAFFYPDNFDGRTLQQADMRQGAANGQEIKEYYEQTGEKSMWTNSLFGGMPAFQISPSYPSNSLFEWLNTVYGLGLPAPSNLLFMMMFGFLILLVAMRMRWYLALIGAIAWGFSSYYIIIIGAGHIWKFLALTYVPPTIAGIVLAYRGRYVAGGALTALFAMLQLNANHPQMSYYFAFVILALVIAWLVEAVRAGKMRRWWIASAVTLVAGALAVGANLPSLYNTYEYSKETKRAQSELTPLPTTDAATTSAERPTGGMPKDEIVGWSYGQAETFSLLVPNIKGGASARPEQGGMVYMGLDRLDDAKQYANTPQGALLPYLPQYFNDSEGTNGPVYVGAAICLLFLLGCFVVKGPVKWALVAVTVLSILLAWGRNFEALTDLMIYNFPLYNKFRAVESILVIAEFTMPLLAILGLEKIYTASRDRLAQYRRPLYISTGICAFFCLLALVAPGAFGDAITSADRAQAAQIAQQVSQMGEAYGYSPAEIQTMVYQYSLTNPANAEAITQLRYGMVRSDASRSLIFVLLTGAFVLLYLAKSDQKRVSVAAIGLLVLFDLFGVDKRYISSDSFIAPTGTYMGFAPDDIDASIMQDTDEYRVMDIPGFGKADRSYYHHMIGGYHAAKLNRYEDLIQRQLMPAIQFGYQGWLRDSEEIDSLPLQQQEVARRIAASYRTLDMLNARYIITGDSEVPLIRNTRALGNAWLVDSLAYVAGADAEMAALQSLDPAAEAVADERFRPVLGTVSRSLVPGDTIALTDYTPNRLTYHASTANGALGVFSEVWFPWGWKAEIDGAPAELGRVNYILRAMKIPSGEHTIVMTFDPESLHITGGIAYACVSLIYLLVLLALFMEYRRRWA